MTRRALAVALVLACASSGGGAAAQDEPPVDLASEAAKAWLRTDHYEVRCGEHRVGWMRRSLAATECGGVPAVAREAEIHLDVTGDGDAVVSVARRVFGAADRQLLLQATDRVDEPFRRVEREVTRGSSQFDVVTTRRGQRVTGAVEAIDVALRDELAFERLAAAALARAEGPVGTQLTARGMDLWTLTSSPRTLLCTEVTGEGSARRIGVTVAVGSVRESAVIDADGAVLEGSLGPRFRYRRVPEAAAKEPLDRAALAALARVPMEAKLDPVGTIRRLTFAWDAPKARVFGASARQTLRKQGDALVVDVVRDAEGQATDESAYREGLADEPGFDLGDPLVGRTAAAALGGTSDPSEQVARLLAALSSTMVKTSVPGTPSAAEILRDSPPRGDASEHVRLFVAFCRAAGVPARPVQGLAWRGDAEGVFGWHSWAEVALRGRWVAVDPTTGASPAPATHLRVEASPEARTVLWGATFRLVAVERDPAGPKPETAPPMPPK
jgi:transglutaminase-like putative cysteine protease